MDDILKPLSLTTPQYSVLAQLELEPGASNAALARRSFITAQTMHGIVSNLEKRQLIQRKSDPGHGRILCTELTGRGAQLLKKAHEAVRNVEAKMMSTMDKSTIVQLESLLLECFDNLNEETD